MRSTKTKLICFALGCALWGLWYFALNNYVPFYYYVPRGISGAKIWKELISAGPEYRFIVQENEKSVVIAQPWHHGVYYFKASKADMESAFVPVFREYVGKLIEDQPRNWYDELTILTGKNFGDDEWNAWKKWWREENSNFVPTRAAFEALMRARMERKNYGVSKHQNAKLYEERVREGPDMSGRFARNDRIARAYPAQHVKGVEALVWLAILIPSTLVFIWYVRRPMNPIVTASA